MGRFDALTTLDTKPTQPSPLPEKPVVAQSTSKPLSMQTGLPANQQTRLHTNPQTGKQVTLQTGKKVFIEKYSSYLTHEYKKELKRIALETDRNEYEVLIEVVEQFLEKQKK